MVPPPPQYQQQPPQQPPQQWMPQYQVPPPQQPPAAGYYYQQPQPQTPAVPPQQYAAPPTAQPQETVDDGIWSLWIGDLQYWMDEQYLYSCFATAGEVVSAKVIRSKQTGQSEGYGFIEFASHAAAERNLQTYNGSLMPNERCPVCLSLSTTIGFEVSFIETPITQFRDERRASKLSNHALRLMCFDNSPTNHVRHRSPTVVHLEAEV
ncbi:hypothetical protein SASPL_123934 [Salvia splendens]|uniref:RRM domain-containing protein n=1 Tax=Salvia splendens TaxID=180675 RepID=A0A8X8ZUG3_SALSN|nr:hypothetical protein SASPL_123934 [Salvia splendens]